VRVVQSVRSLSPSADIRWTAAAGLVWQHWADSDEWVVFHPASGDVHLLSAAAAALLHGLEEKPADLATLVETLDLPGTALERPSLHALLAETLAAFDRAGLVEPLRP
jgi:PqqD family protein of HPr-rel-A system